MYDLIDKQTGFDSIETINGGYCVSPMDQDCNELHPRNFILPSMYENNKIVTKEIIPILTRDIDSIIKIIEYNLNNNFIKQAKREIKKLSIMVSTLSETGYDCNQYDLIIQNYKEKIKTYE